MPILSEQGHLWSDSIAGGEEMKLKGKVAIITGASRGIGREIALLFAREGAKVVIAAKTVEPQPTLPGTIYTVAKEVEELGSEALAVQANLRQTEDIEKVVSETMARFGRIDILINNAGALWWYPVEQTPANRFDLVMDVNVRATFLMAQAVLPHMKAAGGGHIINMSPPIDLSVMAGKVAYMISKFGMTMTALGLAKEVKKDNISVNALWPVTLIESLATINFGLGDPSKWRKASILADATLAIVTKAPTELTGKALLDEDLLRTEGVTDFSIYNCVPDGEPMRIIWDNVEAGKLD
jgi:citronellol/citronellal dehydrogenase